MATGVERTVLPLFQRAQGMVSVFGNKVLFNQGMCFLDMMLLRTEETTVWCKRDMRWETESHVARFTVVALLLPG